MRRAAALSGCAARPLNLIYDAAHLISTGANLARTEVRVAARSLQSCCGAPEEGEAADEGVRGMPEDREHMAASAHVPGVRACGLLRLVEGPPCAGAFPWDPASADAVRRARRGLAVVLCGRGVSLVDNCAGLEIAARTRSSSLHFGTMRAWRVRRIPALRESLLVASACE